jgi:hypothetical protein
LSDISDDLQDAAAFFREPGVDFAFQDRKLGLVSFEDLDLMHRKRLRHLSKSGESGSIFQRAISE